MRFGIQAIRGAVGLAAMVLSTLCSSGALAAQVVDAAALKAGDALNGASLRVGRRTMALPAGSWTVVASSQRSATSSGEGPMVMRISLQEIVGDRLSRTLEVSATATSGRLTWIDEPCKAKNDSYWMEDRKRNLNDQF